MRLGLSSKEVSNDIQSDIGWWGGSSSPETYTVIANGEFVYIHRPGVGDESPSRCIQVESGDRFGVHSNVFNKKDFTILDADGNKLVDYYSSPSADMSGFEFFYYMPSTHVMVYK